MLIFVIALVTLRSQYSDADQPFHFFPGGDDVGTTTRWPEPDWISRMRSTLSIYN